MALTLSEWDRDLGPYLQAIETGSRNIRRETRRLAEIVEMLPSRPSWQTNAEDALRLTIAELQEVQQAYKSKPTGE